MNDTDLKYLWQTGNEQIAISQKSDKTSLDKLTKRNVSHFLSSMKPIKIFTLLAGLLWVLGIGYVLIKLTINAYDQVSLYFLYSAYFQVMLTAVAVILYIIQLSTIYSIDFNKPVVILQKTLIKLKASTLNITKILILQLPFWTTFYWNESMFKNGTLPLFILQGAVTISFTYLSLWLFFHLKFENADKWWFKLLLQGKEWEPLITSINILNEMEEGVSSDKDKIKKSK
ncbi:MAG: hypothetical protein NWR79_13585 [Saprospiraceae bacterium]|nr:hypothetical protein [Saprospiraceae bacterium]MDP4815493.1 hypothetical protein [Saprospiraceae bacterium]